MNAPIEFFDFDSFVELPVGAALAYWRPGTWDDGVGNPVRSAVAVFRLSDGRTLVVRLLGEVFAADAALPPDIRNVGGAR